MKNSFSIQPITPTDSQEELKEEMLFNENSITSNNSNLIHTLDAAYACAFLILLINYVCKVVWNILPINYNSFRQEAVYLLIVAGFLTIQLLRMYYYLKKFEVHITKPGFIHFLEILPESWSIVERVLRLLIALCLVFFSKFHQFDNRPEIVLGICFFLLILWDWSVWKGLKKNITDAPETQPYNDTWKSAKKFFYLHKDSQFNKKKYGFVSLKFYERALGLTSAVWAFLFMSEKDISYFYFFIICACFTIIIILIGFLNNPSNNKYDFRLYFKSFGTLILTPIFTIFAMLQKKDSPMNNIESPPRSWFFSATSILLLIFTTLMLYQCNSSKEIRIATSKNLWCTNTLIALNKGYFEAEGLKTEVKFQTAGRQNMDALLGGTVDFANVVETNIAYQALSKTNDLSIHGCIVKANDYAILTRDSQLIRTENDLKGKKLSFAQATGAESFIFWFLEKHDIPIDSISLIKLSPPGLVDNFLGGGSDAVATWEPFVTTIQKRSKSLGPLFRSDKNGFRGIMTVATRNSFALSNPAIIDAYNRAMIRSSQYIHDSAFAAQKIMAEETGLSLEEVQAAWDRFDFSYSLINEDDARLVEDVIKRIKQNVPEMANKKPDDIRRYFKK